MNDHRIKSRNGYQLQAVHNSSSITPKSQVHQAFTNSKRNNLMLNFQTENHMTLRQSMTSSICQHSYCNSSISTMKRIPSLDYGHFTARGNNINLVQSNSIYSISKQSRISKRKCISGPSKANSFAGGQHRFLKNQANSQICTSRSPQSSLNNYQTYFQRYKSSMVKDKYGFHYSLSMNPSFSQENMYIHSLKQGSSSAQKLFISAHQKVNKREMFKQCRNGNALFRNANLSKLPRTHTPCAKSRRIPSSCNIGLLASHSTVRHFSINNQSQRFPKNVSWNGTNLTNVRNEQGHFISCQ